MTQRIVVLTGAGISAESGVKTFRDEDGLWESHHIEEVATPEGYAANPTLVEAFYNARWQQLIQGDIAANPAHIALALLEQHQDCELMLVTQNIDNLHERGGSKRVLHMHGELAKGRCPQSQQTFILNEILGPDNVCTCCIPAQKLRPHVVWFGEMPFGMDSIHQALAQCDLFIAIGTSGSVYPAAGFVDLANQVGALTLNINLAPRDDHSEFQYHWQGKASELVPQLVTDILAGHSVAHNQS
ncbi:Sir2 family NAD+-dependent deacetylase [Shewanella sp. NIFS-20-20]|uniref:Sir2 family NAD+-dependent deacetylase n=1 Tax=Shewanella sp. NIFS-20-20 TaxID=2853806 RepID=UPI001C472A18|nr:Sir2 family NAD+-dependent deacetylase [Shewanella sp. NIFS-20-20]MBV7315779.1 NAD-dependent protein deacylase [Shewanella sp. NIFS-20-20]